MSTALTQTLTLSAAVILSFVWSSLPGASRYNLQAIAVINLVYFLSRFLLPRFYRSNSSLSNLIAAQVFITITLILVTSTGFLTSPLFFLLQFLLFFLALLFHPVSTALTAAVVVLGLIVSNRQTLDTTAYVNLLSLTLITPVAILFGQKFLLALRAQNEIKGLNQEIATEETATLIWLSTVAKSNLTISLDIISQIISSNKLPWHLQEKLKESYRDLLTLYRSADSLKTDITTPPPPADID